MGYENCSIIINSCDAYSDVWKPLFSCLKEYWKDCPYQIYLNTEKKSFYFDNMKITSLNILNKKNIEWGERLLDCLSRIKTEYVIMLFDDFCLEKKVNQKEIDNCLKCMEKNVNIDAFYLVHIFPELINEKLSSYVEVPLGKNYRLNSAPCIWRKESLMKYTGKIDTAWAWEYFGTFRMDKYKNSKLFMVNNLPDIYPYNYSIGGAIHRGKWVKEVIEPINQKYQLNIDFTKRGFDDNREDINPIGWLIKFNIVGVKMIGLRAVSHFLHLHIIKRVIKKILSLFGLKIQNHPLKIYKER